MPTDRPNRSEEEGDPAEEPLFHLRDGNVSNGYDAYGSEYETYVADS